MIRELRLLVVSHVTHYAHEGGWWAYGPYAREIEVWADLFSTLTIAAPVRYEPPPRDCLRLARTNIALAPIRETGGLTAKAKLTQLAAVPRMVLDLSRAMLQADAIHVRCPGNLGLLGVVLAPMFSRYLIAKYAGQWNGYAGEPATVRLQRFLLRSRWWRGPVTVYGSWPNQPPHIVPFFTSMMTAAQVTHANRVARGRRIELPLRVLYSGMLQRRKRVNVLIEAIKIVTERGLPIELTIVGDGPERAALVAKVAALGLSNAVRFTGALPFDKALAWCEWASCLVLPSKHSEGWPKVVAEGMCHGMLCIAVRHGQVPAMLESRGILLDSGSANEIADALAGVIENPAACVETMHAANSWAREYSLEGLRDALERLCRERWQTPAVPPPLRVRPSAK